VASLTFLGGAGTVTGSKHLLDHGRGRLLIDCGLFQGVKELRERNWQPLPVKPSSIDAVVLTHAHLDHSGYLPRLVRNGFRGPVYATPASIDIARLILLDSAMLQEKDAAFANRHGFSRHHPALPLYTRRDAESALEQMQPVDFHSPLALNGGELMFRRAGHILGAATAELNVEDRRIVFSGDLGRFNDPLMPDPDPIETVDILVVESTYGNRRHPDIDPAEALGEVIDRTVRRGGTVIIPAFAVGRAQSILYHLWDLRMRGRLGLVPVFVDSPMAASATDLLCKHMADHRLQEQACRDACSAATYVQDVDGSKELSANKMPKVIISASGMLTGGRVLHHLKAFGRDPKNTILFSGFQAAGTRGRSMINGERRIKIHGDWYDIRAEVSELTMLSAHADCDEIMRWLGNFAAPPKHAFIVHGEAEASMTLLQRIQEELNWQSSIPAIGETAKLD
jgi:metallo-beta-lactamase family protein